LAVVISASFQVHFGNSCLNYNNSGLSFPAHFRNISANVRSGLWFGKCPYRQAAQEKIALTTNIQESKSKDADAGKDSVKNTVAMPRKDLAS
jgi:hypothetical protein